MKLIKQLGMSIENNIVIYLEIKCLLAVQIEKYLRES